MSLTTESNSTFEEVKIIKNNLFKDNRGYFNKVFFDDIEKKLSFKVDEIFYSINNKGVIRGIHFQKNPHILGKIINCIHGEILDFFIDLRKDSETYGKFSSELLSEENNISLLVPEGFGHGFSVISETATVLYLQSGNYSQDHESGINPLSLDFDWHVDNPTISERDLSHNNFDIDNNDFKL